MLNFNLASSGSLSTINLVIGIVIAIAVALILIGGIRRIGKVTETLVPFMALLYILLGLGVVILNIQQVPAVFQSIFEGAFHPAAFTGGMVGTLFTSMKKGVSRGIFSNEAGLGTGSIAHATADTSQPVKQGLFGIFEVFTDTIVICTLTALIILCSGINVPYGQAAGAELTIQGFTTTYGGWVSIFTAILHYNRMGTLRLPLHRISFWDKNNSSVYDCLLTCCDSRSNGRLGIIMEYRRNI